MAFIMYSFKTVWTLAAAVDAPPVEWNFEAVSNSRFGANVWNLGRDAMLLAPAWFLVGLYRPVNKKRATLTSSGLKCGTLAYIMLGIVLAFSLITAVWGEDSSEHARLEISAATIALFSMTLPGLVGVAEPWSRRKNGDVGDDLLSGTQTDEGDDDDDAEDDACCGCQNLLLALGKFCRKRVYEIINLVAWSPAGTLMMLSWGDICSKAYASRHSSSAVALWVSFQWVDLMLLAGITKIKAGSENHVFTGCLILKVVTWVFPLMQRSIAMMYKSEHIFDEETTKETRPFMLRWVQVSNLTMLVRTFTEVYFRSSLNGTWLFWWTIFMWATTPIKEEDIIDNTEDVKYEDFRKAVEENPWRQLPWWLPEEKKQEREGTGRIEPEQLKKLIKMRGKLRIWEWMSLVLRCVGWLVHLVLTCLEWEIDADLLWVRFFNSSMLISNIASLRTEWWLLRRVHRYTEKMNLWDFHFQRNLQQISAMMTTCFLTADLLVRTWYAHVELSVGRSEWRPFLSDIHWIAAISSITVVMLPKLLCFSLSLEEAKLCCSCYSDGSRASAVSIEQEVTFLDAAPTFLFSPVYLLRTVSGFHAVVELLDVVFFILIIRAFAVWDYDTTSYQNISSTVDVRILLFGLLTSQMLVWLMPVMFFAYKDRLQAEKFERKVLQFSLVVEIFTDFPELVVLLLWGGWRGRNSPWIVITLVFDIILTLKSTIFNAFRYGLCDFW